MEYLKVDKSNIDEIINAKWEKAIILDENGENRLLFLVT